MKVIITGSSGMVGRAALLECMEHPDVTEIVVINRSSITINHPKLKEIVLTDFSDFTAISSQLSGFDACFHCMGVSVVGLNETKYTALTYGITKSLADVLFDQNPEMVFCYVSGTGSDRSESGNIMWARVKGRTENYILNKGFKDAYAFRPGVILPEKGVKSKTGWYNAIYVLMKPFYPFIKNSKNITLSSKLGKAMINSVLFSQPLKHLENSDINKLSLK